MDAAEEDGRLSRKKFILIINKTTIWTPFERRRGLKWQIKRINRVRQLRNFITEEMLSHKLVQNIPLTTTLYQPHHICRFLDVSIFSPSVPVPYCLIASSCNYTFPDFYTKLANTILTAMHMLCHRLAKLLCDRTVCSLASAVQFYSSLSGNEFRDSNL